jgi:hypothetical protein
MTQPTGRRSETWPEKNLSHNVSKTKELIVNYRKWLAEHAPIHIDRL